MTLENTSEYFISKSSASKRAIKQILIVYKNVSLFFYIDVRIGYEYGIHVLAFHKSSSYITIFH
jgi:hypothetical protein